VFPCLIFAPNPMNLTFKGGTNVDNSPPIDFLIQVLKPTLEKFGIKFEIELKKRGFYPKGGGIVSIVTNPVKYLQAIDFREISPIQKFHCSVFTAGYVPQKVAERLLNHAQSALRKGYRISEVEITTSNVKETSDTAFGDGCGILITATSSTGHLYSGSAQGIKGVSSEEVAQRAVDILLKNISVGGCVDEYLQDQLIIFMSLAAGKSYIRTGPLTLHSNTSIHFCQLLTGAKFKTTQEKYHGKDTFVIECEGIDYQNPYLK